jgi:polyphosphate kinase 2 (PPK2 family)
MNRPNHETLEQTALLRRIEDDIIDGYDEELELELEDRNLEALVPEGGDVDEPREARRTYFRELFRLQGELVKLQDWVAATKQKVVVVFEGRDSAGKGGVIKRITQRLNPRVCRVVDLPAPNDRERTQWYSATFRTCPRAARRAFDRSW